jgi:hypothetical protein
MDRTLTNLLAMARLDPSDSTVGVFADRLCEVSADDRREVLQGLLRAVLGFDAMTSERCNLYGSRFNRRLKLPDGEPELEARQQDYSRRDLLNTLARAIECDHWYAIRLGVQREGDLSSYFRHVINHTTTLQVLPLDGGQVREVGDA